MNASDIPPEERRLDERVFSHSHVTVRRLSSEEEIPAQVMNISEGGARLVCKVNIPPEERIEFSMENKVLTARILESRELFDGFSLRAEFILQA